ncbi:MAG: small basic family protein [Bacillota bacterium]|jgi:small basic protein
MLIPLLGTIAGILLGFLIPVEIPVNMVSYTAVAIMAGLDAIFGGMRAQFEGNFSFQKFLTSFFINIAVAAVLTWIGDLLGIDIYIGAVVAFSIRIFNNLSILRGLVYERLFHKNK